MSKKFYSYQEYGKMTNSDDGKPYYERETKTLEVKKKKNKFIIYELNRKQKPKRVKTLQRTKERKTEDDVIKDYKNKKIKINSKFTDNTGYGKTKVVQTNYYPNRKGNIQLIAIVSIENVKTEDGNHYTCYSNKFHGRQGLTKAREQLLYMAYLKFVNEFGFPEKTADLISYIQDERYLYYTSKDY
jgi:hypothetical protein